METKKTNMIVRAQDRRSVQMEFNALTSTSFGDMVSYYVQEALEKLPKEENTRELGCLGCNSLLLLRTNKLWDNTYRSFISCTLCGYSLSCSHLDKNKSKKRLLDEYLEETATKGSIQEYEEYHEDLDYDEGECISYL